jgi:hypothetical protein
MGLSTSALGLDERDMDIVGGMTISPPSDDGGSHRVIIIALTT